jgi:hypothetical protein
MKRAVIDDNHSPRTAIRRAMIVPQEFLPAQLLLIQVPDYFERGVYTMVGHKHRIVSGGDNLAIRLDCQSIGADGRSLDSTSECGDDRTVVSECGVELTGRRVSSQRKRRLRGVGGCADRHDVTTRLHRQPRSCDALVNGNNGERATVGAETRVRNPRGQVTRYCKAGARSAADREIELLVRVPPARNSPVARSARPAAVPGLANWPPIPKVVSRAPFESY